MSERPPLGLESVDLLLEIAESSGKAISSTALDDFHKTAGTALIAAGALKPDGFEAVSVSQADHDDAVVNLTWSGELNGYAYFNPSIGLVRIEDDRLRCFKLDMTWFLQWIARSLGFATSARPVCLIPDRLWDLGQVRLGEGKRLQRRTTIFFARRLAESETVAALPEVLRMHSARPGKVILTTTNDLDLVQTIIADAYAILTIKKCGRASIKHFELNPAIVYSAAHGLRASRSELPVQADADFRVIRVGDREFHFRGDKQRQVVGFLYKRWETREGRISAAIMFEELGLTGTNRPRDLFKGHPDWRDLIGYEDGACWLRCDEILTDLGITPD